MNQWLMAIGLIAFCALAPLSASATDAQSVAETIAARLDSAAVLRGQFVQQRQIAGFSKALKSTGNFVAARGMGVIWDTATPFPSRLVITPDAMRESAPDGSQSSIDAAEQPALREVNRILLAVLQGDVAALDSHFDIRGDVGADAWTLELKPRGGVAQIIEHIQVSGGTHITAVKIAESNGDRSEIQFSAHASTPAELSPAERSALLP